MTTDTTTGVVDVLATAAATVATTLASGEPLTVGEPSGDPDPTGFGSQAVLAQFTGALSGDLLIVVADEISTALRESDLGPLDLAAALSSTVAAVAAAIGPVALGPLQIVDARLGISRVLAAGNSALIPLVGAEGARAAVAMSLESLPSRPASPAGFMPLLDEVQNQRLDLLRGVQMQATVELGRAKMTVNELLSLRPGAVVELDRAAGTPADLFVNGRLIARGEVVVVDENYGLRITHVITEAQGR